MFNLSEHMHIIGKPKQQQHQQPKRKQRKTFRETVRGAHSFGMGEQE